MRIIIKVGVKIGTIDIYRAISEFGSWIIEIPIISGKTNNIVIGKMKFFASLSLLTIEPTNTNNVENIKYPKIKKSPKNTSTTGLKTT